MELIYKKDAIHAVLHNDGHAAVAAVQNIKAVIDTDAIDAMPTIDAVPVVRCKDCLWRHDDSSTMWLPCMERETPDDWFCADGERRRDE